MILADFVSDFLGWTCLSFALIVWVIGQLLSSIGQAAEKLLKDEDVQEGFWIGLQAWFMSDDDDN